MFFASVSAYLYFYVYSYKVGQFHRTLLMANGQKSMAMVCRWSGDLEILGSALSEQGFLKRILWVTVNRQIWSIGLPAPLVRIILRMSTVWLMSKISGEGVPCLWIALMQTQHLLTTTHVVKWPRRNQVVALRYLYIRRDLSAAIQLGTCHCIIKGFQWCPDVFLRHRDSCSWCLLQFYVVSSPTTTGRYCYLINCQRYQRPNDGAECQWVPRYCSGFLACRLSCQIYSSRDHFTRWYLIYIFWFVS